MSIWNCLGAHQWGCDKQMGRPTPLHQVSIPQSFMRKVVFNEILANNSAWSEEMINNMTTEWKFNKLMFRHQDMAEDLQLRPDWNKYTPQYSIFLKDPSRPSPCDGWNWPCLEYNSGLSENALWFQQQIHPSLDRIEPQQTFSIWLRRKAPKQINFQKFPEDY